MICQMESSSCPRKAKKAKLRASTEVESASPPISESMDFGTVAPTSSESEVASGRSDDVEMVSVEGSSEHSNKNTTMLDFETQLRKVLECQLRLFRERFGDGDMDSLYENAYLLLDQELQPISPATDIPESMRIYEEHKKLAQEYLKCRTEIECLLEVKESLEKQRMYEETGGPLRDTQNFFKELRELQSENVGLQQLHQNLKKQLEIMKKARNPAENLPPPDYEPEPGWVMVERK